MTWIIKMAQIQNFYCQAGNETQQITIKTIIKVTLNKLYMYKTLWQIFMLNVGT